MVSTSRTVRFRPQEIKLIEEFLNSNPFFDFSSLSRTAIMNFIRKPELQVKAINELALSKSSPRRERNL